MSVLVISCLLIIFYFINYLEIENLKVVKNQNQLFKTPNVQYFKAVLYETETITLLELPSLAPPVENTSEIQGSQTQEVCMNKCIFV